MCIFQPQVQAQNSNPLKDRQVYLSRTILAGFGVVKSSIKVSGDECRAGNEFSKRLHLNLNSDFTGYLATT